MRANLEVLNDIYQNAQMGIEALDELVEDCEAGHFKKLLETQKKRYEEVFEEAEYLIGEVHETPKDVSKVQTVSSTLMIKLKTLSKKTPSHFAEMLIQGTVMGIIQLSRIINNYTSQEIRQSTLDLAQKLLDIEEQSIEELKKYL